MEYYIFKTKYDTHKASTNSPMLYTKDFPDEVRARAKPCRTERCKEIKKWFHKIL